VEHEYRRDGALNLIAAFDTRTGRVYGKCFERKRQVEFIDLLEHIDESIPRRIRKIHIVCDNIRTHSGKEVQKWLKTHPRFAFTFTPVHCSWMNQIEQWFSILQRKRLKISDFESKADLRHKVLKFIEEWNEHAHPFNWSKGSVAKIMADAPQELLAA
jgi:transposase